MQLKYHMKGQTRSQHIVKIAKNAYYKSHFMKIISMNNLKQCTITVFPPQTKLPIKQLSETCTIGTSIYHMYKASLGNTSRPQYLSRRK